MNISSKDTRCVIKEKNAGDLTNEQSVSDVVMHHWSLSFDLLIVWSTGPYWLFLLLIGWDKNNGRLISESLRRPIN